MITPQKQIVIQDVMETLVSRLPDFKIREGVFIPASFGFGDEVEINRTILDTEGKIYPLIWLLPGSNDNNVRSNVATRDLIIIVATIETAVDKFNKQRLKDSFKQTLFPIRDYLVHVLSNSGATTLKDENVRTYERPRYIDKSEDKIIDNWDAIRIECTVEFKRDKCIKNFTWKT